MSKKMKPAVSDEEVARIGLAGMEAEEAENEKLLKEEDARVAAGKSATPWPKGGIAVDDDHWMDD